MSSDSNKVFTWLRSQCDRKISMIQTFVKQRSSLVDGEGMASLGGKEYDWLWSSFIHLIIILWLTNDYLTVILRSSCDNFKFLLYSYNQLLFIIWSTHDHLMINLQPSHDQLKIILWSTYNQLKIILRSTYNNLIIILRSS